ncbi:MAG: hypothetical protein FJ291_07115 [Planctomycetes bacterium]|nr:hypothetical protein [Planctomycetota bacterium]
MRNSGIRPVGTDTIPRASVEQFFTALSHLASNGGSSFDLLRRVLYAQAGRRAPGSECALWTVARDVLAEFHRLGYATVGVLPRRRSDVGRLGGSPCEITNQGQRLAEAFATNRGQAYDSLLLAWMAAHPYFLGLIVRVLAGPIYVPDVTNAAQAGEGRSVQAVTAAVVKSCLGRLSGVGFPPDKAARFESSARHRVEALGRSLTSPDLDNKAFVDLIQDGVVIPSLLHAEGLPFDAVTFKHLLKAAHEFFAAASTSAHPDFVGRVVFSTCDFTPTPADGGYAPPSAVQHHGYSYARPRFADALVKAYSRTAGVSAGYADAYALRAIVCVGIRIQPLVFGACLRDLIAAGEVADPMVYTELPFTPPPPGESYVESGTRRIGRIKLKSNQGA